MESSVATIEKPSVEENQKVKKQPPYNVILWDSPKHTWAYVIVMLKFLFGYPYEKGYQMADEVNSKGKVVVKTTTLELAELKRDQILAFGKDDAVEGCSGSMHATIEPTY